MNILMENLDGGGDVWWCASARRRSAHFSAGAHGPRVRGVVQFRVGAAGKYRRGLLLFRGYQAELRARHPCRGERSLPSRGRRPRFQPEDKNSRKKWARRLVETGVAVLRFDKRGVGDSDGEYRRGYADFELLSGDLVSAVDFVANDPRVDIDRIRLLGSRQAGWILPMVATRSPHVAFVILLSGPTVTGAQHNYWDEIADDESLTIDQLTAMLADFVPPAGDHDPRLFLEAMTMPALWMLGREDRIIASPRSAEILEEIVAEFQRPFTVIMYENAGHGLRDVESNDRIPYWDDLLPWLEGVIR